MIKTRVVEAIVLSQKDYGEADKLLRIFSKQMGKVTVLAKGVRRIKSRRSGNVDVLNHAMITLAFGTSFPLVVEAQVISSFQPIKENLTKTLYTYYVIELIDSITPEEEINLTAFLLLKQIIDEFAIRPRQVLLLAFELKLLLLYGFLSLEGFAGQKANIVALAQEFSVQSLKKIAQTSYDAASIEALQSLVRKKFKTVVERELKSPQIISALKQTLNQIEEIETK